MFNNDFYPTPTSLIELMLKPYRHKELDSKLHILEPSAGKGDIIDYIRGLYGGKRHEIYAIEKEVDLQAILRTKECRFLHSDFLNYHGHTYINFVVMNPPFSNGDEHLLKAWNVLEEGNIVCLLNAQTIKNPHTKTRQALQEIIDLNGSVEFIQNGFAGAERKTNVEVAIVRLKKYALESKLNFENVHFTNSAKGINLDAETLDSQVATSDAIGNMVILFDNAVEAIAETIKQVQRLHKAMKPFGSHDYSINKVLNDKINLGNPIESYNSLLQYIKENAWDYLFRKTQIRQHLTAKVGKDFMAFNDSQMSMDFNKENIYSLLEYLILNKDGLMRKALEDTFAMMTSYNEKNKIDKEAWNKKHKETWKTNSHYMVNQKVILPSFIYKSAWGGFHFYPQYDLKLEDIDKSICYIMGVNLNTIVTIRDALNRKFGYGAKLSEKENLEYEQKLKFSHRQGKDYKMLQAPKDAPKGEEVKWESNKPTRANGNITESTFFYIEYFLKGTIHLHFKYRLVWETFNIEASKGKNELG